MPDCPECDDPLMPMVMDSGEDGYTCINCDWYGSEDDAPAETGSPLDVRAQPNQVKVIFPDPRRHFDETPWRTSPDAARRLAEALEQAADDAERRGEGDDDGGVGDGPDKPESGGGVDL